jgi:hypothetical protein
MITLLVNAEVTMQRSRWAILWAVVLILGGGFLLAQNLELIGQPFQASIWTVLLGGLGLLFLLDALTTKGQDWWALIPGCVLLGVAATIWLGQQNIQGEWIGSLMLFSVALPFLLIFVIKRGTFWWALIPGGILAVIAVIPILTLRVPGEVIGAFVLWAIGVPFIVVYLVNRKNWWALIPGGALIAIGIIPILTLGVRGEAIGTFVMWVIGLAFVIVYLANRKNWWALIPGGVMFVIGVMPLLALSQLPGQFIGGIFFVGLAAVFGLIYAINLQDPEMHWAIYPAAVLLAVGIGVMAFGQNWWPLVLIALGAVVLIRAVWPRK